MASTARKTIRRTPSRYCRTHTANTSVSESNPDPNHDSDSDSAWSTDMDTPFVPSSRSNNTPTLGHPAMDTSSNPARASTRPARTSTATTNPTPPATPPPTPPTTPPPCIRRPADHPNQVFPSWRQMLGHACLAASLVAFFAFVLTAALATLNAGRGGETPVAEHGDHTDVATTTVTVAAVPAVSFAPGTSRVVALVPGGLVLHVPKGDKERDVAWSTIWFTGTVSTTPAARTKKDAKDKRVLGKLVESLLDQAEARVKEELPGCTPCV